MSLEAMGRPAGRGGMMLRRGPPSTGARRGAADFVRGDAS
jgi:hypothetical protein